eukprot:scaffold1996_cov377-Prasinococcus_capsulatus_cf.AAC.3
MCYETVRRVLGLLSPNQPLSTVHATQVTGDTYCATPGEAAGLLESRVDTWPGGAIRDVAGGILRAQDLKVNEVIVQDLTVGSQYQLPPRPLPTDSIWSGIRRRTCEEGPLEPRRVLRTNRQAPSLSVRGFRPERRRQPLRSAHWLQSEQFVVPSRPRIDTGNFRLLTQEPVVCLGPFRRLLERAPPQGRREGPLAKRWVSAAPFERRQLRHLGEPGTPTQVGLQAATLGAARHFRRNRAHDCPMGAGLNSSRGRHCCPHRPAGPVATQRRAASRLASRPTRREGPPPPPPPCPWPLGRHLGPTPGRPPPRSGRTEEEEGEEEVRGGGRLRVRGAQSAAAACGGRPSFKHLLERASERLRARGARCAAARRKAAAGTPCGPQRARRGRRGRGRPNYYRKGSPSGVPNPSIIVLEPPSPPAAPLRLRASLSALLTASTPSPPRTPRRGGGRGGRRAGSFAAGGCAGGAVLSEGPVRARGATGNRPRTKLRAGAVTTLPSAVHLLLLGCQQYSACARIHGRRPLCGSRRPRLRR